MSNEDFNDELNNDDAELQPDSKEAKEDIIPDIKEQESDAPADEQSIESSIQENLEESVAAVDNSEAVETQEGIENIEPSDYENSEKMITVRPVKFQQFEMVEPNRSMKRNLDIMQDISMHISVELGKTKSTIKEVMDLTAGSIVELDKIAGEQVEVYANNKLIARGEVIVIEDKFGVRVTSTNIPKATQ